MTKKFIITVEHLDLEGVRALRDAIKQVLIVQYDTGRIKIEAKDDGADNINGNGRNWVDIIETKHEVK